MTYPSEKMMEFVNGFRMGRIIPCHIWHGKESSHVNQSPPTSIQWPSDHHHHWPFQEPKLEVPIPYIRPIFQAYVRGYTPKIWPYMVQYLYFRILKFPLTIMFETRRWEKPDLWWPSAPAPHLRAGWPPPKWGGSQVHQSRGRISSPRPPRTLEGIRTYHR